jgi:hypothetical protein
MSLSFSLTERLFECDRERLADPALLIEARLSVLRCRLFSFVFRIAASMSRFTASSCATSDFLRAFAYADKRRESRLSR